MTLSKKYNIFVGLHTQWKTDCEAQPLDVLWVHHIAPVGDETVKYERLGLIFTWLFHRLYVKYQKIGTCKLCERRRAYNSLVTAIDVTVCYCIYIYWFEFNLGKISKNSST